VVGDSKVKSRVKVRLFDVITVLLVGDVIVIIGGFVPFGGAFSDGE